MKYKVYGTIEHNFSVTVEADSEQEAEEAAIDYAEDGAVELSDPVDEAEITRVELVDTGNGQV